MRSKGILADPTLWVRNGETYTPSMVNTHIEERRVRGFSRYDWWNFCDYLYYLFLCTCDRIANDVIVMPREQHKQTAQTAYALATQAYDLNKAILEAGDQISFEERMRQITQIEEKKREFIKLFLTKVFPYLPKSSDAYYTQVTSSSHERHLRGFSAQDATVIQSYLIAIMTEGINWFTSERAHGYAGNSETEWRRNLRKMNRALQHLDAVPVEKIQREKSTRRHVEYTEGMDLLVRYFSSLWD